LNNHFLPLPGGGMRLLLIRHGETVDNVAGIYAGITDSALTNHGVLQANRLGSHLADSGVRVSHLFSSDLQRAFITAEAVREAQLQSPAETTTLQLLREQDFGSLEGKKFFERPREGNKTGKDAHLEARRDEPGFVEVESIESMRTRVETFIDAHLVQLMHEVEEDTSVAVVAHGIILGHLWKAILKRFHPFVTVGPDVVQSKAPGFSLEYLSGWSNTGYLDLEVKRRAASSHETSEPGPAPIVQPALDASLAPSPPRSMEELHLVVKAVNSKEHLKHLKKTRGGIGSLKHDSNQKKVDSFFKKRQPEPKSENNGGA
ncbi:histidine phosphatase superfamily, partial [Hyaloscypha finlandica]